MQTSAKIIINGKVQMVGFRTFITYLENDRDVPLNSGMRESFKFCSVRGLIAASGGRWL